MGKRTGAINNNNNSSNVLSQQRILNDLTQMTKNDVKPQMNNTNKKNKKNQKQQQQQQKQQQKQQQASQPKSQPKQKPKQKQHHTYKPEQKPLSPEALLSNWIFFTNNEWKGTTKDHTTNIEQFANRGNIRAQLEKIQEIQIKYTYTPEKNRSNKKNEEKKMNKRKLRAAASASFPPSMHSYRRKQLLQEMNNKKQQRAAHERVTNLLVKRYTQKMNKFAEEYQKAYKTYQEGIKENLGIEEIKNSRINAHKKSGHQHRLEKKAKLQKKHFKRMSKRILESHTSPAQWTAGYEKMFQTATQKILTQGYDGFNYFGRPEYNRSLAWVEANENSTTKDSISVASVLACQYSPIPGETRVTPQNRVPTVPPTQMKAKTGSSGEEKKGHRQPNQSQQKPMTIKTQTPEQYRQRLSGGKNPQKKAKAAAASEPIENGKGKKNSPKKMEQKPLSPSVVNPGPATWVTESELPDSFAWGILQHQPNGNDGRNNKKRSGRKNKDDSLNLLFPNSAPNTGSNKKQSSQGNNNSGRQNRKPQGYNISEML